MVYTLSRTHQCHVVIFTSGSCWTTIGTDSPISGARLLEICQIHLLHIGLHMYAEIKLKLFVSISQPAIMEAPCSIIPSVSCSADESSAIDLTIKYSEEEEDGTTAAGDSGESSSDHHDDSSSLNLI